MYSKQSKAISPTIVPQNKAKHQPYNSTSSSGKMTANREYLTRIDILPLSTTSLAPDTTQYPGTSCGPLIISMVSTNLRSFCVCAGIGGPSGYKAELMLTSDGLGGGFCPVEKWLLIILEIIPDFWAIAGEPSHSGFFTTVARVTVEKCKRIKRTLFMPDSLTSRWAPVTIERSSSDSTGAVHICEKLFHWTFS